MREKIVITGMGAVTPIGDTVERFWENLLAGESGIDRILRFPCDDLAVQIAAEVRYIEMDKVLGGRLIRQTDAFTQYAMIAAREALGDTLPADPERTGIVMGTAMAGVATTAATQDALTRAVHKNVGPRFVPRILGNIAASQIAIDHDIRGPSLTLSTACASGADAVSTAIMLLLSDDCDAVLAVGADSVLCPLVLYSLANAHALSRQNSNPKEACRPFDRDRNGFVIGEGGAALVLETESHAKERGARILAEVAGWANNSDAFHVTDPDPEGKTAARCMQLALRKADIEPEEVSWVNAHATGTKAGDSAEVQSLMRVFGDHVPAVSSIKAATGHMMGASGLLELVASVLAIRDQTLPPVLNLHDPEWELDFVREARKAQVETVLSNSFGFGGQNSSILLRKI